MPGCPSRSGRGWRRRPAGRGTAAAPRGARGGPTARRGAVRRPCTRSTPGSRPRARPRRWRDAVRRGPRPPRAARRRRGPASRWRGTGLMVPTALEARPTATSRGRPSRARSRLGHVEGAVGRLDVHPAHLQAALLGDGQPGRHVGIVVEARDDDGVATAQRRADGPAERIRDGRHVRPEADLVCVRGAEEVGRGERARRGRARRSRGWPRRRRRGWRCWTGGSR